MWKVPAFHLFDNPEDPADQVRDMGGSLYKSCLSCFRMLRLGPSNSVKQRRMSRLFSATEDVATSSVAVHSCFILWKVPASYIFDHPEDPADQVSCLSDTMCLLISFESQMPNETVNLICQLVTVNNGPSRRGLGHHSRDNPGPNRWFLKSTPIQVLPPGGCIYGLLT